MLVARQMIADLGSERTKPLKKKLQCGGKVPVHSEAPTHLSFRIFLQSSRRVITGNGWFEHALGHLPRSFRSHQNRWGWLLAVCPSLASQNEPGFFRQSLWDLSSHNNTSSRFRDLGKRQGLQVALWRFRQDRNHRTLLGGFGQLWSYSVQTPNLGAGHGPFERALQLACSHHQCIFGLVGFYRYQFSRIFGIWIHSRPGVDTFTSPAHAADLVGILKAVFIAVLPTCAGG